MQIPIASGIYTDEGPDFRISYPLNLIPVPIPDPKGSGVSVGYLRPAPGVVQLGAGPGVDRGAFSWNGVCYRVMGTKLVTVSADGNVTVEGDVGGSGPVIFGNSFDHLAVESSGNFYLWDGASLQQVVDADLGTVVDFIFVDGYWLTTDGENLVVTELSNPFAVDPLKYGSSEVDPDPVLALLKLRNEPYALNRYTIEAFQNIGGDGFPFQRIDGAQIGRGVVGTHACEIFQDAIVFVGGARDEAIGVWLGANGVSVRLSTREIELILAEYSEAQLSAAVVRKKVEKASEQLLIYLPDRTLAYDATASKQLGAPIWFVLSSGLGDLAKYRAANPLRVYDRWMVGDTESANLGYLSDTVSSHWGGLVDWQFGTLIVYNEGRDAIVHELELVALTGRAAFGDDPRIWTQYSTDGETWSMQKSIRAGSQGQRNRRLVWLQQGMIDHMRMQRFGGTSDAHCSFARLEARLEGLA